MKNYREGKKQDGKYYLRVGKTWVEVNREVYYGYMDLVWKEEKNEDRRSRCMIGGKRCTGNCKECNHDRTGSPLSLDQMKDIDVMDMVGYIRLRAWNASREKKKNTPRPSTIDNVWPGLKP